jgi:cellulose biosynthesis protein BcsQ
MKGSMNLKHVERLKSVSIAVGSGKGGVGKSTTALNLAVFYSKLGLKVGLFDLDPLSNIATILDIDENRLRRISEQYANPAARFADFIYPAYPNLDIVFPRPKLRRGDSAGIRELIYGRFAAELLQRYGILIYDLPAGIGAEENLAFLPYVRNLLVVTNAEPTSHVSAGGYIKAALEICPDIHVYFWHNKFSLIQDSGFNPRQVIDNYNRYVGEELKVDPLKVKRLRDIAFIPHDQALDLLNSTLSLEGSAQVKLLEICEMMQKKVLADIPLRLELEPNTQNLIRHYLAGRREIGQADAAAAEIEDYCLSFYRNTGTPGMGKFLAKKKTSVFTARTRTALAAWIARLDAHPLRSNVQKAAGSIEKSLAGLKDSLGLFAASRSPGLTARVHADLLAVLQQLSRGATLNDGFTRNLAGVLLFYFALFKLMPSRSVQKIILEFIPKRRNAGGRIVRDKRRQIRYLIVKDAEYHRKYFSLIKALFPLVLKQLETLVDTFRLQPLVLKAADGDINRNAYLKLLTSFVHDSIHAGLGVFIGFKFNAASEAIKKGARDLLAETGIASAAVQERSA